MKTSGGSCVSLSNLSYCQKSIESETVKTSEVLKKTLGSFSESVKGVSSCSCPISFHRSCFCVCLFVDCNADHFSISS